MTIKELEERLGMSRANIRFYESEGLIHPVRDANGYRNYSEEDAAALKKVKYLRSLDFTLDEIRRFQGGDSDLYLAVRRRLNELEASRADYNDTKTVLENLRHRDVTFASLDIDSLFRKQSDSKHDCARTKSVFQKSEKPSAARRFFARGFDCYFYTVAWELFKAAVFELNITYFVEQKSFLSFLVIPLMTLIFEPLFLHFFQTTPGKAILGIRVTDNNQNSLSWSEGAMRTFYVLTLGMGLNIPVLRLCAMLLCWRKSSKGEDLWWDYDASFKVCAKHKSQIILYILSAAGVCVLLFGGMLMCFAPEHTGDLTVEEFAENYNTYRMVYDSEHVRRLETDGKWAIKEVDLSGNVHYYDGKLSRLPDFEYLVQDGVITSIKFTQRLENQTDNFYGYSDRFGFAIYAFVSAYDWLSLLTAKSIHPLEMMNAIQAQDVVFEIGGIEVRQTVLQHGYEKVASIQNRLDFKMIENATVIQSHFCYYEPVESENWLEIEFTITKKQ